MTEQQTILATIRSRISPKSDRYLYVSIDPLIRDLLDLKADEIVEVTVKKLPKR